MADVNRPCQGLDDPLYNSRVIKNYVEYVKKFLPSVEMDAILGHAGITIYELEDQGHWFSQRQVDRFHERLVEASGDPRISRKVGRYAASSKASGALKHYALGFMSPATAYWTVEKIAPHLTRASTVKSRKLKSNKFELTVTPRPGSDQKPYQCENLMGQLESLTRLFSKKYAKIDHPRCIHKGGDACVYEITLEKSASFIWRASRNYFLLFGLVVCMGVIHAYPSVTWLSALLFFALFCLGVSLCFASLENRELARNIERQQEAAKLLLDQINTRYNDAQLVKEIGQAASELPDIRKLLDGVTHAMAKRLDYDRGGFWLTNPERTSLVYTVGYGYKEEIEQILRKKSFRLDNASARGVAVRAFHRQTPILVDDPAEVETDMTDMTERSLEFMKKTGSRSFICVPLVYEEESLGVLLVDNVRSKRPFSESDISLLMGIATQVAISIRTAMSYLKLRESKEREQSLRKLFERYVPAPIIRRYLHSEGVDLFRGEESPITVLFLDLRGFTSSSENMDAKDVVSFLNSYFERCSSVVFEGKGHINKYTGDGFLAIFGAPEPLEDHVRRAFATACRLLEISRTFLLAGKPIAVGIGIHTGEAILGNIGSRTKIEYTAVGNTVNIAARLQEYTKQLHDYPIIMSGAVREGLVSDPRYAAVRSLGKLKIRGKKEEMEAFGFSLFPKAHAEADDHASGLMPLQRIKGV
jgi:class 3 adenylate cyclase